MLNFPLFLPLSATLDPIPPALSSPAPNERDLGLPDILTDKPSFFSGISFKGRLVFASFGLDYRESFTEGESQIVCYDYGLAHETSAVDVYSNA